MALQTKKFFSTELLPAEYGDKTKDDISNFNDRIRKGYRFSEGEEVVHIHNHKQVMVVEQILRKLGKQEKVRLDGIVCHWWES